MVAIISLVLTFVAHAGNFAGRVVKVTDGDTIVVLDAQLQQHKIRLAGIDAPENAQDFGTRSRINLAGMVAGRTVTVETSKVDRYGRLVGVVVVNGKDANLAQVQQGMAWWYRAYAREQSPADRAAYSHAEEIARTERRGLWAMPAPVAPWDWRRSVRKAQ
ncbi:MAG: thermonuclease family protein [Proteobacteria bacterium]|nr:thermonuclease family protein [Pseudomonadota bacterium]